MALQSKEHKTICIYTDMETFERVSAIAAELHLSVSATITRLIWERQLQAERPSAGVKENG